MGISSESDLYKLSTSIPDYLASTQQWFANIITNQLEDNGIQAISPHGLLIAEEATHYILPSPTLRPHQRVQIYNQQYWWRLLNTLHESFPLVTRLFGYYAFNEEIAVPYLVKYPPHHWSLSLLGEHLPHWIQSDYKAADGPLVYNAACLDQAFNAAFIALQKPALNLRQGEQNIDMETLLTLPLFLQPHIHLFHWTYDLFAFRQAFIKQEVDYWTDNDFPLLNKEKDYYYVLYRSTNDNNLYWKETSPAEYSLLKCLQKGSSIEETCDFLEKQDKAIYEDALSNLQEWFQKWTVRGWLTLEGETKKSAYKA